MSKRQDGREVELLDGVPFREAVEQELQRARSGYPPFNSAHEGFAILKEEVDELWDEVKVKQRNRDLQLMWSECVQVAAMAQRIAEDVLLRGRGRV